jgi:MOSC domain-containing protein YiiM
MHGTVVAVHRNPRHRLAKLPEPGIELLAGLGVEGDAHAGETVQHRSRKRWNPGLPNLRQVHLFAEEMLAELRAGGFDVAPGVLGENVTTRGLDLLALPAGARLGLGSDAVVEITGLRNPCVQLERFQPGLMEATLDHDAAGGLIRRAGIMTVVACGGTVRPGDAIAVELPAAPHVALKAV